MAKWFTRCGKEYTGEVKEVGKGRGTYVYDAHCTRCGGRGESEAWKFTGWTCYQCGGTGGHHKKVAKVYTEEKLAQMNATAEKARIKREAKKDVEHKEHCESALRSNRNHYPETMQWLERYEGKNNFINDLKCDSANGRELTARMVEALEAAKARDAENQDFDAIIAKIEENRQPAPEDRINISGYILSAKWKEGVDFYGNRTQTLKLLIVDERGFKVWCTAPKNIPSHDTKTLRKSQISFKVRLTRSEDDEFFAFGSRPGKITGFAEA